MSIFVKSLVFGMILSVANMAFAIDKSLDQPPDQTQQKIRFFSEVITPYYWFSEDGTPQGFNVDVANALGKKLNIPSSIDELPWARAFQETLHKPNNVLLSLLRVPKRENQFQWLGLIRQVEASLVGLNNTSDIELASLEDAKQLRVGTIRGYGSADYLISQGFIEGANLILVSDTARLWQLLYEGRIDLVVSDIVADRLEVASIGLDATLMEVKLLIPALSVELQVATGSLTPSSTVKALQDAMTDIRTSGELQALLIKWGLL